jgi:hypothetical protein
MWTAAHAIRPEGAVDGGTAPNLGFPLDAMQANMAADIAMDANTIKPETRLSAYSLRC